MYRAGGKPSGLDGVPVAEQGGRRLAADEASAHRGRRQQAARGRHAGAVRRRAAVLQDPRADLRTGKGDRVGAAETRSRSAVRQSDQKQRAAAQARPRVSISSSWADWRAGQ